MWECPDFFELNGHKVLSFCPQGLESSLDRFANVYQSGYIMKDLNKLDIVNRNCDELKSEIKLEDFVEWDLGFDFYAPQTFKGEDGNIYLIGWAGVPDAPYGNAASIAEGWQHSMTLVRRLSLKNNKIYQEPVIGDIQDKFEDIKVTKLENNESLVKTNLYANIEIEADKDLSVEFNKDLKISYNSEAKELLMEYFNDAGDGRDKRKAKLDSLENLSIFLM